MAAEGSSGPARGVKRTAARVVSDSEDDNQSSAAGSAKKKKTTKTVPNEKDELMSDDEDLPGGRERLSAKAKGKAKANGHANGNGAEGSDEEMGNEEELAEGMRPKYQRGSDGYVAGSIVRIRMVNFMTYDRVEFRPGPYLNMILGPNGTGKSSIAAAIAVGLGFPPKTMARHDHLRQFVKQGCEDCEVEIELKAFPGKRNPVILRKINFESDKSQFRLNGQPSTKKIINEIVAKFGAQADNLCCFLAQDKVSTFAQQGAEAILAATMKSAGDSRLTNWHQKLVSLGGKQKALEGTLDSIKADRDRMQNEVNKLAPDVQHFEAREALEKQERDLEVLLVASRRCELLRHLNDEKTKKKALKKELAQRVLRSQGIRDLASVYKKKLEQANKRCGVADAAVKDSEKDIRAKWRQINNKEANVENIKSDLNKIKGQMKRETQNRNQLLERKKKQQEILDQPVEDVQAQLAEYGEAKKEAMSKHSAARRDAEEATRKYSNMQNQISEWTKILETKAVHLNRLSSIQEHKEEQARHAEGTLNYVLKWLAEHEGEFEAKVHKPPMISVNLKDKRFANQVESGANWNQRCTFIVTTKNDYDRMLALNRHKFGPWQKRMGQNLVNQGGGSVRLNLALVRVDDRALNPQKGCSDETLRSLGFAGWASAFVDAEPPVIAFLNEKCGFSKLAVTNKQGDQIDAVAAQRAGIHQWATANDLTTAGQSKYGRRDPYMQIRPIKQAEQFNVVVDTEQVAKLQEEITKMKRDKRDAQEPSEELRAAQIEAREKVQELEREVHDLNSKMKELREQNGRRTAAAAMIKRCDEDLAKLGSLESFEAKRAALRAKMSDNLRDRVTMITGALAEQENYLVLATGITRRRLEQIQLAADVRAIDEKIAATSDDITVVDQAMKVCSAAIAAGNTAKNQLDDLFRQKVRALGEDTADVTSRLHEVEAPEDDPTAEPLLSKEQITIDLQGVRVQLQLSVGIDREVVDRYHQYVAQLEVLIKKADTQGKDLDDTTRDIEEILNVFEPAVDALINVVNKEFSNAFDKVGCSGEVELHRPEGQYDKWGIRILVSYRDSDELALLTGERQSGGERSLATITYLMSLSKMSRTPFSLVDEINQGMDQRAERNVHNQLVNVTCDATAGQYFLITPKLLTELTYHPKMKILNVNNGPWLPAPEGKGHQEKWADFRGCIQRYRDTHGMGSRA